MANIYWVIIPDQSNLGEAGLPLRRNLLIDWRNGLMETSWSSTKANVGCNNIMQQYSLWSNHILVCVSKRLACRSREIMLSRYLALVRLLLESMCNFVLQRRTLTYWNESGRGSPRSLGSWSTYDSAQRHGRCPIPGNISDQVWRGSEQPDLV